MAATTLLFGAIAAARAGPACPPPLGSFVQINPTTSCTSSTTHHETDIRVDLPQAQAYVTGVIGKLNGGRVFDQTFHFAPGSPQVSAGFKAAVAAITAAGGPAIVIGAPRWSRTASSPARAILSARSSLAPTRR